MKRRAMIRHSAAIIGSLCFCSRSFADETQRSDCCFTPEIEPESLTLREDSVLIDLPKAFTINEPGYAAYLTIPEIDINLIIIHDLKGEYHALTRFCTHGRQVVSYVREREVIQCNNFNHSNFNLDGKVRKGPAPLPLKSYDSTLKGKILTIYLV